MKLSPKLRHSVANVVWGALARRPLQPLFQGLHWLSLRGMNFGGGSSTRASGEHQALELLARGRRPNEPRIVFDVGANAGQYAIEAMQTVAPPVRVLSFEPSHATFQELTKAAAVHPGIEAYLFGMGARRETVPLYTDQPGSGIASVFRRRLDHFGVHMHVEGAVELRTIDDFCEEHRIERIDLLKLDIEGNEMRALEGARVMIDCGAIDLIQFEFGGCNMDSRTYFQDFFYLLDPTYRIHRVLRHGLAPVDRYLEMNEVFVTTNYLAIRRGAERYH